MPQQEDILSKELKDILIKNDGKKKNVVPMTDFLHGDESKAVDFCQGAFLTVLAEAQRRNWDHDQVVEYLRTINEEEAQTGLGEEEERRSSLLLLEELIGETVVVGRHLARTRAGKTQLASFRYLVHHEIYNSVQGRLGRPRCLIELRLMNGDKLLFSASRGQLQDLVAQFKEIAHNLERKRGK